LRTSAINIVERCNVNSEPPEQSANVSRRNMIATIASNLAFFYLRLDVR
jgi:hypothetical protein